MVFLLVYTYSLSMTMTGLSNYSASRDVISFCACAGTASVISFVQVFVGENTNLFKVLFQPDLFVLFNTWQEA